MFPDDAPLIPSGFRIIPLDPKSVEFTLSLPFIFLTFCLTKTISNNQGDLKDALGTAHRTLDLTSSLEVGPSTNNGTSDALSCQNMRSVLIIAFQFPFDNNLADSVANMARQYVRSVINSVQRVAMAISPSGLSPSVSPKLSPGSPEALTLAQWICQSYT